MIKSLISAPSVPFPLILIEDDSSPVILERRISDDTPKVAFSNVVDLISQTMETGQVLPLASSSQEAMVLTYPAHNENCHATEAVVPSDIVGCGKREKQNKINIVSTVSNL